MPTNDAIDRSMTIIPTKVGFYPQWPVNNFNGYINWAMFIGKCKHDVNIAI